MDKFSELKRMAEKCPVQRFEPFIGRAGGRGTQAIFNADTKGEVITWSGFDSSDVTSRTGREAIARFVAAVDPDTVLSLLAALEFEKQNNSGVAGMVEDYETKLEAKDKRIAELESANKSQDDHINQQQDRIDSLEKTNAGLGRRLGDAEKRLATPVRLPDIRQSSSGDRYQRSDGAHNYRLDVISMLLGAGFTVAVEGVE